MTDENYNYNYSLFQTPTDPALALTPLNLPIGTGTGTQTPLYETPSTTLLHTIIKNNDIHLLTTYIEAFNLRFTGVPAPEEPSLDPFHTAAAHGSLESLILLLDVHKGNPNLTSVPIKERGFSLLNVACENAQGEIVRYILDSSLPLGGIDERENGWTPMLCTAYSACTFGVKESWRGRSEMVMELLLARGAGVGDVVVWGGGGTSLTGNEGDGAGAGAGDVERHQLQPSETVLSLAIAGSSYNMTKRLLDSGADAYQRVRYYSDGRSFPDTGVEICDVTALHLAARCWNVDGVKALLDHTGHRRRHSPSHSSQPDLRYSRDSTGRLPLHWAAAGPGSISEPLLGGLDCAIVDTVSLLVQDPESASEADIANFLNTQDTTGATPLHYAISTHARCGTQGSNHAFTTARWLCSHGADASRLDKNGQSVLHYLAHSSLDGEAINPNLIDLLIAHGAPLDHVDRNGETALHVMARHLCQSDAVEKLVACGARVDVVNKKGNLPVHEGVRGALRSRLAWDGRGQVGVSLGEKLRAQSEVVDALMEGAGYGSLKDQLNRKGKTARQVGEETRRRWREMDAQRKKSRAAGSVM
ncbi:ankyrin repeat-containing domain protein [Aspergillus karnatakaensis]|uniref:ankyrin repeat-containing domain protein n=1 Tax=Aspergillus karnatakaensis TaxID=1810916 RepID=UPI003CCCE825